MPDRKHIARTCQQQYDTSRGYKQERLKQIQESEDLYFGKVGREMNNPFKEPFPFMEGYIDHALAKIDDPPRLEFRGVNDADRKVGNKLTGAIGQEIDSPEPHALWPLKDRLCKRSALFAGVGVMALYGERSPKFAMPFEHIDYYDFHMEPGGGPILEYHMFMGQDNVFRTREELIERAKVGFYDQAQVADLIRYSGKAEYRDALDQYDDRTNRDARLGLSPGQHNFTGQELYRLAAWYPMFEGKRWQVVFDTASSTWLRVVPMSEVSTYGHPPYVMWHTSENANMAWSKAPADGARAIAKIFDKFIQQEAYNREKINFGGARGYDPELITDLAAFMDNRPDNYFPVNTNKGRRKISEAVHQFETGQISNTLDFLTWLDTLFGQKTGQTPGSQGVAERDKKVGVFLGEMQQVQDRIGLTNKSYTEAWHRVAIRAFYALKDNLKNEKLAVQQYGPDNAELADLLLESGEIGDIKRFRIKVIGGAADAEMNEQKKMLKSQAVVATQATNPRWKDEEILKNAGYKDDEIKRAFSSLTPTNEDLISEAAEAYEDILAGREPKQNRGATVEYMQYLIDRADQLSLDDEEKENTLATKIYEFARSHQELVMLNEERRALSVGAAQPGLNQPAAEMAAPPGI